MLALSLSLVLVEVLRLAFTSLWDALALVLASTSLWDALALVLASTSL